MNYQLHYDKLIERAHGRVLPASTYSEKHHITPKCIGGSNHKDNLVRLTAEEHFVAHQLLAKMFPKQKRLAIALHRMVDGSRHCKRNNKRYGWIRRKHSEALLGNNYGAASSSANTIVWANPLHREPRLQHGLGNKSNSGYTWATNGFDNKHLKPGVSIPDGYHRGRTL